MKRAFGLKVLLIFSTVLILKYSIFSVADDRSFAGRVVFIPSNLECVDDETNEMGASAILAYVLPTVVDEGLDLLSAYLKNKAESHEAEYTAQNADVFYSFCNGELIPKFSGAVFAYGPIGNAKNNDKIDRQYSAMGFTSEAHVYLELDFVFFSQEGQNIFRIAPKNLEFHEQVAKSGSKKDLVFTFSFSFPTANAGKDKPAGTSLNVALSPFSNLEASTAVNGIQGQSTAWMSIPVPSKTDKFVNGDPVLPFSLIVGAKETDKGNGARFYFAAQKLIEDNKDEIAKGLNSLAREDDSAGDEKAEQ